MQIGSKRMITSVGMLGAAVAMKTFLCPRKMTLSFYPVTMDWVALKYACNHDSYPPGDNHCSNYRSNLLELGVEKSLR